MLLISPLHHSKKVENAKLNNIIELSYFDYMKMELHKKTYLDNFTINCGEQAVEEFRRIIGRDEEIIKACYAEKTDYVDSPKFIEMMLLDTVFIFVYFLQLGSLYTKKTGDFLFDEPSYQTTIFEDLILLENQLPYFLLEKLFEPFLTKRGVSVTFRDIVLEGFKFKGKIKEEVEFLHFTDLYRRVRVDTLGLSQKEESNKKVGSRDVIKGLPSAYELWSAGIRFKGFEEETDISLEIKFKDGILTMPCFSAQGSTEIILRNIMALEQCHYTHATFFCNYIFFLDFLIDTKQDVDFLVEKGVIRNWMGHEGSIAEMVNKLCLGVVDYGSNYYDIAKSLNKHCKSYLIRSAATLWRVYFKDLWTGTATSGALIILVLTLIGTVASVLQVKDANDSPTPPPPPPPAWKH